MSHPDTFNLNFVRFEEDPPPGVPKDSYHETKSKFGWIWNQCDHDAEGWCRYWDSSEKRDAAIEEAGGVLPFLISEDSPTGDLTRALRDQLDFQAANPTAEQPPTVTLNVNGTFFDLVYDEDYNLVEKKVTE